MLPPLFGWVSITKKPRFRKCCIIRRQFKHDDTAPVIPLSPGVRIIATDAGSCFTCAPGFKRRTMNTSEKEALDPTERVASDLVHIMCAANGVNEFFENALPPIAEKFGAKRVMLIDYHE